jgi:copper resistance protein C
MDEAVTRVYNARAAMLKSVKAGDKVKFNAEAVNGRSTVTKIERAKRWRHRWHRCPPQCSTGLQVENYMGGSTVLVLSGTMAASAHAHLVRATPAVGSTVQAAPGEVALRFSEKLEPKFSSVVVRDSAGKQVDKGDAAVDKADRMLIRVLLPPLEPGVYKVEWKAVSADTHKVDGDFTFKIGQ